MGRQLISIKEWYRKGYGVSRVRTDYVLRWLEALAAKDDRFTFLQTEDDFYVEDEAKLELLKAYIDELRAPKAIELAAPSAEADGLLHTMHKKIQELEELFLEQEARVDGLHKAVQEMATVYGLLRNATNNPSALPETPKLPTKYKYRVVIVGGDSRFREHVEGKFPQIKVIQVEIGGGNTSQRQPSGKQGWPTGDFVAYMINFAGHSLFNSARIFYGDQLVPINGSGSALEAAIRVWLHNREMAEKNE